MIKIYPIVKGTSLTLLAALGLIMIVTARGRSAPPTTEGATEMVRAVKLRLIFEGGDAATVTQYEGTPIKIEKDGMKLAITPIIRDQSGQVELQVSQAVQREGKEVMQALDTLIIDKNLTKLTRDNLPFSVKVLDANKKLPAGILAASSSATCCTRTCAGVLICGVCVCTDCGICRTVNWCDCPPPGPIDEE